MEWAPQDVDAALGKVGRPSCLLGGRLYEGRILSIEEFTPYQDLAADIGEKDDPDEDDLATLLGLFRDYGHTIFEDLVPPLPRWKQVWEMTSATAWRDRFDPTEELLTLPPVVALNTFMGFFQCQLAAMDVAKVGADSTPYTIPTSSPPQGGGQPKRGKRGRGQRSRSRSS